MITIIILTGNDIFYPDPAIETSRLLHEFATSIRNYGLPLNMNLQDENGNTVAHLEYTIDED